MISATIWVNVSFCPQDKARKFRVGPGGFRSPLVARVLITCAKLLGAIYFVFCKHSEK